MPRKPPSGGRPSEPDSQRNRLERGEARQLRVVVSTDAYRQLKIRGAMTDRDMSEMVEEAIEAWLEAQGEP